MVDGQDQAQAFSANEGAGATLNGVPIGNYPLPPLKSRLLPQDIHAVIVGESYHRVPGTTFMVCFLSLRNGYIVTGESACADPAKFSQEKGEQIARENAVEKVWTLEGYLLKQRLSELADAERGQDDAVEAPRSQQDLRSRGEPRVPPHDAPSAA